MSSIKSKAEFYGLYYSHQLGNHSRLYHIKPTDTVSSVQRTVPWANHPVMVRHRVPNSPYCRFDLSLPQYLEWIKELGLRQEEFYVNELLPDHANSLQGEVTRSYDGDVNLWYSIGSGLRMRPAYAAMKSIDGLRARLLLKYFMDGSSHDFLQDLLVEYPDSAIEFCCYDRSVGLMGWNTIFWEIRDY